MNYIAHKSKLLDTYVHVNEHLNTAFVINDSINMARHVLDYYLEDLEWQQANYYFVSKPIPIPEAGSLSHILSNFDIFQYRLGKELVWMGNFENEGSSLWNLNSNSESLQDSIYRRGSSSISHLRSSISPGNIITNLENKFPYKSHLKHTLHGKIKTKKWKKC